MLPPVMTMGMSGSRKGNFFLNLPGYSVFCGNLTFIFALFWSEFLLHKIYGAKIVALLNNAVEVGEKLTDLRDS